MAKKILDIHPWNFFTAGTPKFMEVWFRWSSLFKQVIFRWTSRSFFQGFFRGGGLTHLSKSKNRASTASPGSSSVRALFHIFWPMMSSGLPPKKTSKKQTNQQVDNSFIWMFPKIVGFPPKSSILIWFSIINHPFWGTPIFGNTHINTLNHSGFSDLF